MAELAMLADRWRTA